MKHEYLKWMAENTISEWTNDSANPEDLKSALAYGAAGCTTNPPLSYESLTGHPELFADKIANMPHEVDDITRGGNLFEIVVGYLCQMVWPVYVQSNGATGYVRSQVAPPLSNDGPGMLEMGRRLAAIAPNVLVKIPATKAGLYAIEELAALGIGVNPTVCTSVSQMVAMAEAYERGRIRALEAGLRPKPCTSAMVLGRLQDYLNDLVQERNLPITYDELSWATLAMLRRSCRVYEERGFAAMVQPAAQRSAYHVAYLAGERVSMTLHPKTQRMVVEAEARGEIRRVDGRTLELDEDAVKKVDRLLPEYSLAACEGRMSPEEFTVFGATQKTLNNFNETGWKKLMLL